MFLNLVQGGGVFCNPKSPSAPEKLRLLYECAPLALIVEVRMRENERERVRVAGGESYPVVIAGHTHTHCVCACVQLPHEGNSFTAVS